MYTKTIETIISSIDCTIGQFELWENAGTVRQEFVLERSNCNSAGCNMCLLLPPQLVFALQLHYIYRVSQEECARLQEGVPYVKVYRYNPKHLCPKLNGYGDNGHRKVWSSGGSTHCTCRLTSLIDVCP